MKAQNIEGTVALVTGASRGIGRALTEALLSRGAKKVYAAARNLDALGSPRDARLIPLQLDLTDSTQIRAAAKAAGDVEIVFSNAGVALGRGLADAAMLGDARHEMDVNYFGPLQLLQCLAPALSRNGGGAVVTVGSLAGLSSLPFMPTYSASKAALHSLTQAARVLLKAQGTAVFGAYPGPVDTDMSRALELPKASAQSVALAILAGMAAGHEDIYPDQFALEFGRRFATSPKGAEMQMGAMAEAMLAGSAA